MLNVNVHMVIETSLMTYVKTKPLTVIRGNVY